MSNLPITITVKLFTPYQEAEGLFEQKLEFPKETPVSQVLERLSAAPPCSRIDRAGFGINQEFALAPPRFKTAMSRADSPCQLSLSALGHSPDGDRFLTTPLPKGEGILGSWGLLK
ncbi:hypothetical protein QUA82_31015 [Microcoleus sp. F8-D3]